MINNSDKKNLNRATAVIIFFIIAYFLFNRLDYRWDLQRLLRFIYYVQDNSLYAGTLIKGLLATIKISFLSIFLGILIGVVVAFGSQFPLYSIKTICKIYILTIRNTPLMTQILINYFVVGKIFNINGFWVAVFTLSLFEGSYIAEIIRGSILSIDKQQWLSGYALGMSRFQVLKNVILPQSYPIIIPSLSNILVSTVKDSSLLSIISIYELTFEAQKAVSETFMTFEIWFMVAFLYLSINIIITLLLKFVEKKL
ncbi:MULTISPECIES: amino acid ABC transporter permease [Calditerrivibrio]|uniref:amino acid ABC transporter permease n=1 Tax=Calditerrivibrio TaxID=545865 RepID=UPI003C7845F8